MNNQYKEVVEKQGAKCVICGNPEFQIHHIYEGCYRAKSTKYGALVLLCDRHHRMIHATSSKIFKKQWQEQFEKTHSREEFIKIFGKNYL
jgi:hypothetical protein